MKRYAMIIVCVFFCINMMACSMPVKKYDNENSSIDIYAEIAGKTYDTIDALAVDLMNTQNAVQNNNAHITEDIYCLDIDIPGYKILAIEIMDYNVIYYYVPNDYEKENFDYETGIRVYYKRDVESISGEQLIDVIVDQLDLEFMSDGCYYSSERNLILFPVGNTYMYIAVPDHMNNYDILKEYCQVREITVGTQSGDGLVTG